ncbi:MAG: divalent-cation tolerance protein CutA [Elusimicrobia bacterium]|nr:divalent-cation tolerance protein CutA [Elusimicrobiota bacterium]
MKLVTLFITVPNKRQATAITDALLKEKLVACVSTIHNLRSRYWWKGAIESSSELLLTAKTVASKMPAVIKCVKRLHSYEVPEIIAVPIVAGNRDYLDWIKESVSAKRKNTDLP